MTIADAGLVQVVAESFERRRDAVQGLAADAAGIARACHDMAVRFAAGGRLLVFGNGAGATDSEHIAVEFVHPVIVGKRALPALSLASDVATVTGLAMRRGLDDVFAHQVRTLGRPSDIALGLSGDGDCENVRRGLQAARDAGLLSIALVGGDGGAIAADRVADHCLVTASDDPHVVKEAHVTTYHVLWELVHVFFDSPGALDDAVTAVPQGGVESLYPFLYGGGGDRETVLDSVASSTVDKVSEIVGLRHEVGQSQGRQIAECAAQLATAFAAGATLWAFGNGGSSTDAQDVVHTFVDPADGGDALAAQCLTSDAAIVTALSNDVGYDVVFARQLSAFGRDGDIAVGISTSGGSANVLDGFDVAKRAGLLTVGLSGYGGGRMAELASLDHLFAIPSASVHRVQEVQTTIYHVLWEATRHALTATGGL
jgi:D-sedoheptulose 7-phosphate isomerase